MLAVHADGVIFVYHTIENTNPCVRIMKYDFFQKDITDGIRIEVSRLETVEGGHDHKGGTFE